MAATRSGVGDSTLCPRAVGRGRAGRGGEEDGGGGRGVEMQTETRRFLRSMGSWCKARLLGSATLFLGSARPPRPRGGRWSVRRESQSSGVRGIVDI